MIIGVTGRVGVGKSTFVNTIEKHFKVSVIDLDLIGHELLRNLAVKEKIKAVFGDSILDDMQNIDRQKLGNIVFNDFSKLVVLNQITHPLIKGRVVELVKSIDINKVAIIVGALITEIGLEILCDKIIVLDAEDKCIIDRIGAKYKAAKFQRSRDSYQSSANFVLINDFSELFKNKCISAFEQLIS
jgi:dephospho-CoA kinase